MAVGHYRELSQKAEENARERCDLFEVYTEECAALDEEQKNIQQKISLIEADMHLHNMLIDFYAQVQAELC